MSHCCSEKVKSTCRIEVLLTRTEKYMYFGKLALHMAWKIIAQIRKSYPVGGYSQKNRELIFFRLYRRPLHRPTKPAIDTGTDDPGNILGCNVNVKSWCRLPLGVRGRVLVFQA